MNRLAIVAAAATIVLGAGVVFLMRDDPEPAPPTNASAPPPGSRVVRKKVDSTPAPAPKKAPPKKAEPKVTETPAAAAAAATLRLESDVPGAAVFIDRQFVGNTPLTLNRLEPGSKRVQITATGFDSVERTIRLEPGPNAISIRVKEVSLDAKASVVHKHGMGSCTGTLVATLDGLRYNTTNTGDAFSLPYAQVETFAVDYLQKNLRVKQRGGKTWNFTHDSPDALFVFHRDVEAARKKLAAGYARAQ